MGCLCSHMMLDARDCFENNGGIRLCRLKMPFALQKKTGDKWEREHYKRRVDCNKKKEENRQNKTIYKGEQHQSQIAKHIRVRKLWHELKRKSNGLTCACNWICHKTKFSYYQSSCVSGEFELSLTSTQDIIRIGDLETLCMMRKRLCISIIWYPVSNER